MKAILVVGDGMGDRPTRKLNGKTPLQNANKPSLDEIARLGICGMMDPISPGITPGSDTSHLAIFGYDPYKFYRGRGGFEALGSGIKVEKGDVSFRCNFATVDHDMKILDRRAGRVKSGGDELAAALNGVKLKSFPDVQILFKHSTEHRGCLVLKGPRLSRMVSDSDPHADNAVISTVKPLDNTVEAKMTSQIVNELTNKFHEILEHHPINVERRTNKLPQANAVIFRGAGELPDVQPITNIYDIKALVVAAGALYKGVCRAIGMDLIEVHGATGTTETDTVAKARAAVVNLKEYDYVYIHVKGTDNASHDGDVFGKVKMIEKIDALLGYILKNTDLDELVIAVTADHTTPVEIREHRGDPVPIAIMGPEVRRDRVKKFSEIDCAEGGLGRIRGVDLTPTLMNLVGKSKMFGT